MIELGLELDGVPLSFEAGQNEQRRKIGSVQRLVLGVKNAAVAMLILVALQKVDRRATVHELRPFHALQGVPGRSGRRHRASSRHTVCRLHAGTEPPMVLN